MPCGRTGNLQAHFLLVILCTSMLLFAGCSPRIEWNAPRGDFREMIDTSSNAEQFSFLVVSDIHFGRKNAGVYWETDTFLKWLDAYQAEHPLAFAVNLGDSTSNSEESEYLQFADFTRILSDTSIPLYSVLGNHDVRGQGRSYYRAYINASTTRRFSYGGISFYCLDSGNLSLGKEQLQNLNDAVRTDPNPKIFLSHVPFYGAPQMVYFALGDPYERAQLVQMMQQNKVGLVLSAHLHLLDHLHRFTSQAAEFVCGSFHGRDDVLETTVPTWYVCTYAPDTHTLSIIRYTVDRVHQVSGGEVAAIPLP